MRPGLLTIWTRYAAVLLCPTYHSVSAQSLDRLEPSSSAFRKCLRELKNLCGTRGIIPTSCTPLSQLLDISPKPFASGGYGDVFEGTLNGSKICVKRVRVYSRDPPEKAMNVSYCVVSFLFRRRSRSHRPSAKKP
jgi:hypothetical protein